MEKAVFYILLLSFWAGSGCTGDEGEPELGRACPVEAVEGPEDEIVGKWKMVWELGSFLVDSVDHSCDNIIYHFRPDGVLEIDRGLNEDVDFQREENYELIISFDDETETTVTVLTIGDFRRWACTINRTKMELSRAPLDGPIRHFIRIE